VLFNIDSLFRIASYLPATDLLSLALTYKRFGVVESDNSISLIDNAVRRLSQEIRIGEDKRSKSEGESWLAYYQHLESVRSGNCFAFGKLLEEYVEKAIEQMKNMYIPGVNAPFPSNYGPGLDRQRRLLQACIDKVVYESVLFNSDSLFKIASYLPATDILSLALTCKRFGVAAESDDNVSISDDSLSLIEETARRIVQDVTTEERPRNGGESWLANYHYLQSVVNFDQMHVNIEYVNNIDKSCIRSSGNSWATAFSNNVMKTGRNYVSFDVSKYDFLAGVMRPGTLLNRTETVSPSQSVFFRQNYSQSMESLVYNTNNSIHCCMYYAINGECSSYYWHENTVDTSTRDKTWAESFSRGGGEVGMLLDLDEGR